MKRHGQNFLESCDNWMAHRTVLSNSKKPKKRAQVFIGVYLAVEGM
jgi:hypothetical protein